MNPVSDLKSIPPGGLLSPEANAAAALAAATATQPGILTIDLDAIVTNWRKLEKTAVPAECAGQGNYHEQARRILPAARQ